MLQSCDLLITLGTRLAIPQRGYVDNELARRAEIFVVDCDQVELDKLGPRFKNKFLADAPIVLNQIFESVDSFGGLELLPWLKHVSHVRQTLPLVEDCHRNDHWVDSYSFMSGIGCILLEPTQHVCLTDMGTTLLVVSSS